MSLTYYVMHAWDGWLFALLIIAVIWAIAALFCYAAWQLVALYNAHTYPEIKQKYQEEHARALQQLQPDESSLWPEAYQFKVEDKRKHVN